MSVIRNPRRPSPELLLTDVPFDPDEPIIIASEGAITELLEQGLDSYRICRQLGISALDVANVERRLKRYGKPLRVEPTPIIDRQATGDRRLLLFPTLD